MPYWCDEQLVVTVTGPAGRRVISLAQPFARVGSHPDSEVLLEGKAIPTRCLYLHATPAGVFCLFLDLHAGDGDADPHQKGRWLAPDEDLTIGPYRLRASLLTAEAGDAVSTDGLAVWGSAPRPLPVLMVYVGDLLKDKRRFRARLSPIGRRPQCALQLKGQNVSGFHCVLYWHEQQLWCIDLNASNSTELNGTPITCSRVNLGDRLEVGEFGLVFQRLSYGKAKTERPASRTAAASDEEDAEAPVALPIAPTKTATPPALRPSRVAPTAPFSEDFAAAEAARRADALAEELRTAEIVRAAEQQQLRERLNEEVARLAREREELHATWEHTSHDLKSQISQLHDEAARLAAERQALEQSRQEWQAERAAISTELARRTDQLGHLEAELAAATALLAQKLAAAETPSIPPVPQALVPPSPSPEELARLEEQRQLRAELATQVEQMARERQELQAGWEQSTDQLRGQIAELSSRSQELLRERDSALQSRHEWETERAALAAQLTQRSDQLAHLEADLTAVTAQLAQRLAAASQPTAEASQDQLVHEQSQQQEKLQWEIERMAREHHELQSCFEQSTDQLRSQIAAITAQAEQLLRDRDSAKQVQQVWEADHARLTEQDSQRTGQLARLESELAAVTTAFADKFAALERQTASPPVNTQTVVASDKYVLESTSASLHLAPVHLEGSIDDEIELESSESEVADFEPTGPREAVAAIAVQTCPESAGDRASDPESSDRQSDGLRLGAAGAEHKVVNVGKLQPLLEPDESAAKPEHVVPADFNAPAPLALANRDRLPLFVSDRLVELDQSDRRKQLLWWSAGGIGVAAIVAIAATLWQWLF